MSSTSMKSFLRTVSLALGLFISCFCYAYGGGGFYHGGGGYYHGGGGYYHGGGGYYHGGGGYYHGGGVYYHGGGWGGPGVVIGVPFGGYYPPACQTIRVCNNYGHCWLRQTCD